MLFRTLLPALLALGALTAPAAHAASDAHKHWSYAGAHGARHWAELDAAYETCSTGREQSPIDIRKAEPADLPPLEFSYGRIAPSIVNNGHTIQVNVPPGQFLQVGTDRYELLQFHFHTPSEESFDGKRRAMVAHFVHRAGNGSLGVIAALIQPGKANPAFESVLAHLPQRAGETLTVEGLEVDLAALLPASRRYFDFQGSLTTPPCSERVHWMVLAEPVTVSPKAIKEFRRLYSANARPVQPLNGRVVRVSRH